MYNEQLQYIGVGEMSYASNSGWGNIRGRCPFSHVQGQAKAKDRRTILILDQYFSRWRLSDMFGVHAWANTVLFSNFSHLFELSFTISINSTLHTVVIVVVITTVICV